MLELFEWIKNKFLCFKYKRKDCYSCPYCCEGHDYWGCAFGFHDVT